MSRTFIIVYDPCAPSAFSTEVDRDGEERWRQSIAQTLALTSLNSFRSRCFPRKWGRIFSISLYIFLSLPPIFVLSFNIFLSGPTGSSLTVASQILWYRNPLTGLRLAIVKNRLYRLKVIKRAFSTYTWNKNGLAVTAKIILMREFS